MSHPGQKKISLVDISLDMASGLDLADVLRCIRWSEDVSLESPLFFGTLDEMINSIQRGCVRTDCIGFVSIAIALQQTPFEPFLYGDGVGGLVFDMQRSGDVRYIGCADLEKGNKIGLSSRGQALICIDGVYWGNLPTGPATFASIDEWVTLTVQNLFADLDKMQRVCSADDYFTRAKTGMWSLYADRWNIYELKDGVYVPTLDEPLLAADVLRRTYVAAESVPVYSDLTTELLPPSICREWRPSLSPERMIFIEPLPSPMRFVMEPTLDEAKSNKAKEAERKMTKLARKYRGK